MSEREFTFYNGKIYIDAFTKVSALSVRNGLVCSSGKGRKIDLKGKTIVPAFIDSHCHFSEFSLGLNRINFKDCSSLEEFKDKLKIKIISSADGEWIEGGRWNHNYWKEGRRPVRHDIDNISPSNPVLLYSREGHQALANSVALKIAGLDRYSSNPPGGELERDESGELTGILFEEAVKMVKDKIPPPSPELFRKSILSGAGEYLKYGITSVHDFGTMNGVKYFEELGEELKLRIYKIIEDDYLEEALSRGMKTGQGNEKLRTGHYKIFADGALGSQTAWTSFDYVGREGYRGMPIHSSSELGKIIEKASNSGLAVAVHAIGDQACLEALKGIEKSGNLLRHRIEHFQLAGEKELNLALRLNVVLSMQPVHLPDDITVAGRWWGQYSSRAFPFRSILDNNIVVAFSSDAPIADMNPFRGIYSAVSRCRTDGTPVGGWYGLQKITVAEAVHAYTAGGAFASGEENVKGRLYSGMFADFAVLSQDILSLKDSSDIMKTEVIATFLGGEPVYGELN